MLIIVNLIFYSLPLYTLFKFNKLFSQSVRLGLALPQHRKAPLE